MNSWTAVRRARDLARVDLDRDDDALAMVTGDREGRDAAGANCYVVTSADDAGKKSPAAAAQLRVDGRRVVANATGRACVGRHVGTVRAFAVGAVRSNAVK